MTCENDKIRFIPSINIFYKKVIVKSCAEFQEPSNINRKQSHQKYKFLELKSIIYDFEGRIRAILSKPD